MADQKINTGPEEHILPKAISPDIPGGSAPDIALTVEEAVTLEKEGEAALSEMGEKMPDPGSTTIPFPIESVDLPVAEVMVQSDAAHEDTRQEWEKPIAEVEAEKQKPHRGRIPKAEKMGPVDEKAAKPRKSRPAKADKAALGDAQLHFVPKCRVWGGSPTSIFATQK